MKKNNDSSDPENKNPNSALKYTGIAFQMLAIIAIGVIGGIKLDEYINTRPVFTIILSLLSIIGGIYIAIKDFIKPQK